MATDARNVLAVGAVDQVADAASFILSGRSNREIMAVESIAYPLLLHRLSYDCFEIEDRRSVDHLEHPNSKACGLVDSQPKT